MSRFSAAYLAEKSLNAVLCSLTSFLIACFGQDVWALALHEQKLRVEQGGVEVDGELLGKCMDLPPGTGLSSAVGQSTWAHPGL